MSEKARKKTVELIKEQGDVNEEVIKTLGHVATGLNEHLHTYVMLFGRHASTEYMQGVEMAISFICNVMGEISGDC